MDSSSIGNAVRRNAWLIALLLIIFIGVAIAAPRLLFGPELPVQSVERSDLVQTVVASGLVETPLRVNVGSQLTGTVAEIPVVPGQAVKKGQLLLALEDSEQRAAVEQARATVLQAQARLTQLSQFSLPASRQSLRQAEVNFQNARRQYERNRELQARGFIGQSALDESRRSLDVAESQLQSAQLQVASNSAGGADVQLARAALEQATAGLHLAQARLNQTRILAPHDGTLISRSVERGDVVQPAKVLMVLSPVGKTQLVLQVDERNLPYLQPGQRALASADAYPAQRFEALVAYINPGVDAQRGSVEVKLDVPQAPDYLRQDMTVSVDIVVARREGALAVPADAVHDANAAQPWVMKVSQGRVRKQPLKLGLRGTGKVEVLAGLQEGDKVLLATQLAQDGMRARPLAQAKTGKPAGEPVTAGSSKSGTGFRIEN